MVKIARIKEIGTRGKLSAEFDSVGEVFRAIKKLGWAPKRDKASDRRGRDGSFYTFNSLEEANDIFLNTPEKIRSFSANDDRLETRESPGKDVEFDVTGDYLDMDRYLEGIPEVFGNAVMGNPRTVFATINVLTSMVSYTNKNYQLQKQKRILRLVDWLEQQGVRTQIITAEDSSVWYNSIVVKEFADPFDLNSLAVAMHPDFFRRTMFLMMEQSKTWSGGYGSAVDYDKKMLNRKPNPEDGVYIYVGGYIPYSGNNNGIDELNARFDEIEDSIQDMINRGDTFTEDSLAVPGGTLSGW